MVPGPPANLTSKNTPGEATEPPKHHPQHESQQEKTSCAIPTISQAARIWDGKKKRLSTPSWPIYKWWAICIKRHSIKTRERKGGAERQREFVTEWERELQSSEVKWAPSSIPVMPLLIDPSLVIYVAVMRAEYEGRESVGGGARLGFWSLVFSSRRDGWC